MICGYGCGQEAKYPPRKGMTKWCCEPSFSKCPEVIKNIKDKNKGRVPWNKGKTGIFSEESLKKISESSKGNTHSRGRILSEEHKIKISEANKGHEVSQETRDKIGKANKGKIISVEQRKKISESAKNRIVWNKGKKTGQVPWNKGKTNVYSEEILNKMKIGSQLSISKIKEKYSFFSKIEEMRYNPDKKEQKEIQTHCKNEGCLNSKEKGGWFTPKRSDLFERIRHLEHPNGNDGAYLYCSDDCKIKCPLYRLQPINEINRDNKTDVVYTQEEYNIWRTEVLKRAKYKCEYCGEDATDAHHSRPQKLEPFFSLDPDFGISCCEKCHYKYGHKDECGTGKIAQKVCVNG